MRIDAVGTSADLEGALAADHLSLERIVAGRGLLSRVEHLLADLPERSRTIFRMRKVEGLSQRDTQDGTTQAEPGDFDVQLALNGPGSGVYLSMKLPR